MSRLALSDQAMRHRFFILRVPPLRSTFALALVCLGLCLSRPSRAAATLSAITAPSTVVAGQDFTVSFTIAAGAADGYYAIALSPYSSFTCPGTNLFPYVWVDDNNKHYASAFDSVPDFEGLVTAGINAGPGTQVVTVVVKMPPDAPSTVYVNVVARDAAMTVNVNNPCDNDTSSTSPAITVTGSDPTLHINLESSQTTAGKQPQSTMWSARSLTGASGPWT